MQFTEKKICSYFIKNRHLGLQRFYTDKINTVWVGSDCCKERINSDHKIFTFQIRANVKLFVLQKDLSKPDIIHTYP